MIRVRPLRVACQYNWNQVPMGMGVKERRKALGHLASPGMSEASWTATALGAVGTNRLQDKASHQQEVFLTKGDKEQQGRIRKLFMRTKEPPYWRTPFPFCDDAWEYDTKTLPFYGVEKTSVHHSQSIIVTPIVVINGGIRAQLYNGPACPLIDALHTLSSGLGNWDLETDQLPQSISLPYQKIKPESCFLTPVARSNLRLSVNSLTNMMSGYMYGPPYEPDFMVQETAGYVTGRQLQLVFSLLEEKVDPISIPEYVNQRESGVLLTVQDVKGIRNGGFHVAGPDFCVRMPTTGNIFHINVINGFFLVAKVASSMEHVKYLLGEDYAVELSDHDILDMSYGSFQIAGPETIDLMTKAKSFVPRAYSSEAAWMVERGLPCNFVRQYVRYRFSIHISFGELVHHVVGAAVKELIDSVPPTRPFLNPPCLKQTARRAQPPLPIITFTAEISKDSHAERVDGGTFTANPLVHRHNDDGSYSIRADHDAEFGSDSESDSGSSSYSGEKSDPGSYSCSGSESDLDSKPADSIMDDIRSRVRLELEGGGNYLLDLNNPGNVCVQVKPPGPGEFSLFEDAISLPSSPNVDQSDLFSLSDFQPQASDSRQSPTSTGNDRDMDSIHDMIDDLFEDLSDSMVLDEPTFKSEVQSPSNLATNLHQIPDFADLANLATDHLEGSTRQLDHHLSTLGTTPLEGLKSWQPDSDYLTHLPSDARSLPPPT
jgi:hypothetical protein